MCPGRWPNLPTHSFSAHPWLLFLRADESFHPQLDIFLKVEPYESFNHSHTLLSPDLMAVRVEDGFRT